MPFPVAIEITLLGDGGASPRRISPATAGRSAYQRRIKLAKPADIERALAIGEGDMEIVMATILDLVVDTAGAGGRRSWPISRAFTGAKKKRFEKPAGQPHSVDEFYYDVRKTKQGLFAALKNRTAWAKAVERGAYYQKTGYRRKPLGVLRRIGNDVVRGRTARENVKRQYRRNQAKALEKEMREAQRRERFQKAT